jgi:hypothetical protein
VPAIEVGYRRGRGSRIPGYENTQRPRFGRIATSHQIAAGILHLLETRKRDDEPAQCRAIVTFAVRRIILERCPHVFTRRRKETRVVNEAGEKSIDSFHSKALNHFP